MRSGLSNEVSSDPDDLGDEVDWDDEDDMPSKDSWTEEVEWDAENHRMNMVLMGVPGSGKGSQAKMISKKYGIPQIGMGDIIRENMTNGTDLGRECKGYMDRGDLVPDSIVIEMVRDRLQDEDTQDGYVLDGFPRTLPQGKALMEMADIDHVLFLDCTDDVVIERLGGRRNCSGCGKIYHQLFKPPKVEGICDGCGAELFQRDDDNAPTVRNRLKVFNQKTAPLIEFYENQGLLRRIDANPSLDEVFENVEIEVYGGESFSADEDCESCGESFEEGYNERCENCDECEDCCKDNGETCSNPACEIEECEGDVYWDRGGETLLLQVWVSFQKGEIWGRIIYILSRPQFS